MARRGFTLLEALLATVIGTMVTLTALGLLEGLRRTDSHLEVGARETRQLSTTHTAVQRALQQLVMDDSARPNEIDEEENLEQFMIDGGVAMADAGRARFILEPDPQHMPGAMTRNIAPGEPVQVVQPQRLEVALRQPPLHTNIRSATTEGLTPVETINLVLAQTAERRDLTNQLANQRTGTDDGVTEEEAGAIEDLRGLIDESDTPGYAPGVRGVFELTPDPETRGAWRLWWRILDPNPALIDEEEAELIEAGAQPLNPLTDRDRFDEALDGGRRTYNIFTDSNRLDEEDLNRVLLADGILSAYWEVYRDEVFLDRLHVVWSLDMPAYVTLELETVTGRWNKWMFEVGWTRGPEPGTELGLSRRRNDANDRPNGAEDPRSNRGERPDASDRGARRTPTASDDGSDGGPK